MCVELLLGVLFFSSKGESGYSPIKSDALESVFFSFPLDFQEEISNDWNFMILFWFHKSFYFPWWEIRRRGAWCICV